MCNSIVLVTPVTGVEIWRAAYLLRFACADGPLTMSSPRFAASKRLRNAAMANSKHGDKPYVVRAIMWGTYSYR